MRTRTPALGACGPDLSRGRWAASRVATALADGGLGARRWAASLIRLEYTPALVCSYGRRCWAPGDAVQSFGYAAVSSSPSDSTWDDMPWGTKFGLKIGQILAYFMGGDFAAFGHIYEDIFGSEHGGQRR